MPPARVYRGEGGCLFVVLEVADAAPDGGDGNQDTQRNQDHHPGTGPVAQFEQECPCEADDGETGESGEGFAEAFFLVEESTSPPGSDQGESERNDAENVSSRIVCYFEQEPYAGQYDRDGSVDWKCSFFHLF